MSDTIWSSGQANFGHMMTDKSVEQERMVELFIAYVLEHKEGGPEKGNLGGNKSDADKKSRTRELYDRIVQARAEEKSGAKEPSVLSQLVDEVGWDTWKKAFDSYQQPSSNENKSNADEKARAREFFDRLADYADQARTENAGLPTKSKPATLLDR